MTVSTAELGLSPRDLGIVTEENPEEAELPLVPEIALTPYQILEQGFIENENGDGLVRIKTKRKTGRRVQVLTDDAKDLSESFVEALCGPELQDLDEEQLLTEVDTYYHQLVDGGYNKTAAYRIKQSATFKIRNRVYLQGIHAEPQTKDIPTVIPPDERTSRFGKLKEVGRAVITAAAIGVAMLGFARLSEAKGDLPVEDFRRPTPATVDYRPHLSEIDQLRAEQHYFSTLPLPTATINPADYSAAQTGTNNPEAPELALIQGSMELTFKYPDGTQYTYGQQVGIEDSQDFADVEANEELAPQTLNGLRIVDTEKTPVVHCHQKWNSKEGPCSNFSDKAKEVGDDNLSTLNGTVINLKDEAGQNLNGKVTNIELLSKEDANPIYYQTRVIKGLDGYHILTCHRQGIDGNTRQWLWITVENIHDDVDVYTGYGLTITAPKGTFSSLPR